MSLFVCEECWTIENTALSRFWVRAVDGGDPRALCSACDPTTGEWHGRFERRTYDGTQTVQWVDGKWWDGSETAGQDRTSQQASEERR